MSEGIALHEGRSLGAFNFWASFAFCLGVIFMCVTGPLMWWKRRPKNARAVGAPRGRLPLRVTPLLAAGVVALGVFLPLFGLTLVAVLLLDHLLLRHVATFREWFDVTA